MTLLENALNNPLRKKHGFNVLFADLNKAPRREWIKWQSQAQTEEDIHKLFSTWKPGEATCWGFVTGYNGLEAIDFDWAWVYRLWKTNFSERADTLNVQTPNGGLRPHYLCEKTETVDKFKETLHVELKGPGRFIVYEGKASREDGSIGEYKTVNDKPIREDNSIIADTFAFLQDTLRRYSFLRWNCMQPHFSRKVLGEPSHELRLFISDIMACEGFSLDEMHNLFRDFSDYNYQETDSQLKYTLDRIETGLKPPTCETLRKTLGWNGPECAGCERKKSLTPSGKKKKQQEPRPIKKTCGMSPEGPYESIVDNAKPRFLVKAQDGFKILDTVQDEEQTVVPKGPNEYPYKPYGFTQGDISSREDLFWRIEGEFDTFLDVEPIFKDFLAACVLLSYQQEKTRTVPYGYFYGDNESGKTVALNLLAQLCYRPMLGVTVPSADIYGYLEDVDAPSTILEDEIQGIWKDIDKTKIYKAGYKAGAVVPRYYVTPMGRFLRYYPCFCLKFCASEQIPTLKGFNERFIFIPMVEGDPKKEWTDINGEDLKRFHDLRNTLLKWRLASHDWQLPEVELPIKGRLKELWKPIIQIVSGLTIEPTLRSYLKQLKTERMNEKKNTLEGHIVNVVAGLYEPSKSLSFQRVWESLIDDLDATINERTPNTLDSPEFGKVTKNRVGYRLRELFGGKKTAERIEGKLVWAYTFNNDKLNRVFKKYGVSKLESLASPYSSSTPKNMEKQHENTIETPMLSQEKLSKLTNSLTNIKAIRALDPTYIGSCLFCGKRVTLTWQVQYFNGEYGDACPDCGTQLLEKVKAQNG